MVTIPFFLCERQPPFFPGPLRATEATGILAFLSGPLLIVAYICRSVYPRVDAYSSSIVLAHFAVALTLSILFVMTFCWYVHASIALHQQTASQTPRAFSSPRSCSGKDATLPIPIQPVLLVRHSLVMLRINAHRPFACPLPLCSPPLTCHVQGCVDEVAQHMPRKDSEGNKGGNMLLKLFCNSLDLLRLLQLLRFEDRK